MSGITAQYGFEYQKFIYVKTILENLGVGTKFGFENKDDVDYIKEDPICGIYISDKVIQAKSGSVSKKTFCKVLANWILLGKTDKNVLLLENNIDFIDDTLFESFLNYVEGSKDDRSDSIFNRVYRKYCITKILDGEKLKQDFQEVLIKTELQIYSSENITKAIENLYISSYCEDIKDIELLCKKRVDVFNKTIFSIIDKSIWEKQPLILTYPSIIRIITDINSRYNRDKYEIDINEFKQKKMDEVIQLIEENKLTEITQLKYVFDKPQQVARQIINKLLYEDFKSVYKDDVEISNLEYQAKDNHSEIIDENGEDIEPKKLFNLTISKKLVGEKLPQGEMYSNGCYIHLTSDKAKDEYKIWWKKEDE